MPALDKPAQEAFAQSYVTQGFNSRRAAAVSGLAPSAVSHPVVQARIRELMELQFATMHVDAERVKQEIARIAFQDVRDLYDDKGNLIPPHELSDDAAATIAGIDVEIRGGTTNAQGVTSPIVETRKIRRADKLGALNLLAKHFKIVGDNDDAVGNLADALADRLTRARRRAQGAGQPQDVTDIEPSAENAAARAPEDITVPALVTEAPRPWRDLAHPSDLQRGVAAREWRAAAAAQTAAPETPDDEAPLW
jgi:phage terminase small subunit